MAKILDVISAVTPMGGTIAKLRVLMTRTKKHEHFLYHPGFKSNKNIIEKEIEWYKQNNISAYYGIYDRNIIRNAFAINKIIKDHNIDIVHFYFNYEQSFALLIKLLNPNIILIRSIVGFDKKLPFYRRLIVNATFHFVPNYIYISNYIKNLYETDYPILKKKKTKIIYNGAVHIKQPSVNITTRTKIVTTCGLCERKNIFVLIEAFNIIVNKYKRNDIILYILGDGPERKKCESLIANYQIVHNVILVGYTNQVPIYLDDCAIYLHPAVTEGFGIAVTEAMQMKCPCIVADKGALPELIINNESGFVIDAYDPEIWAQKTILLYDNIDLRVYMGNNAYNRAVDKFSLNAFIDNHDALYDSLVKE